MLSSPLHGWTDFQLDGTSIYALSYLDDIPFEWLDRAIIRLKNKTAFTVTGNLEPGAFRCTVELHGCRVEADGCAETSGVAMIGFCRELLRDLSQNAEAWATFASCSARTPEDAAYRRAQLRGKLGDLRALLRRA